MKQGFIKVGAASVEINVADTVANKDRIIEKMREADSLGVKLLTLPELCVTGYTCGDLFLGDALISASQSALCDIVAASGELSLITVLGIPVENCGKLYNCAVAVACGKVLGVVPKTAIPSYGDLYETRYFASGADVPSGSRVTICGQSVPFSADLVFSHNELSRYTFGVQIGEDLFSSSRSQGLTSLGANIILCPAATAEVVGREEYRRTLVSAVSAKLGVGYVYSDTAPTESTQDFVYSGHNMIAENGNILRESLPFEGKMSVCELDVDNIAHERKRINTAPCSPSANRVVFEQVAETTVLTRKYDKNPFLPEGEDLSSRAQRVLQIQAYGLKKRLEHTNTKNAVIGISGGLDSTLAILVAVRAFDLLSLDRKGITAITMPCFGTTKRTKSNAVTLSELLGVTVKEINIRAAVTQHFADIGHGESTLDVTYENSQARERTQVLMDYANQNGGLVVGTGDMSELALGWATYNGDHMSNYGVNASVPKTLVRYLVKHEADRLGGDISSVLYDILDTPVSPELLPADKDGKIAQKTEDLVGPYELHDFFIYHTVRYGMSPKKLYRLAKYVFAGDYGDEVILHWLKTFVRRFITQQFKRSCLPDGPKVGSCGLSPRGDLRMPSDASYNIYLKELHEL